MEGRQKKKRQPRTRRQPTPFGLVVRDLRNQRGWSQVELAERAEVNRSYISQIENSAPKARNPSTEVFSRFARAFGVTVAELYEKLSISSSTTSESDEGMMTFSVPADRLPMVRWFASVPPELQRLARTLLEAATSELAVIRDYHLTEDAREETAEEKAEGDERGIEGENSA